MSKAAIGATIFALGLAVPGAALAQQPPAGNCPPGSWFCAETNQQPAAPPGQPVQPLQPLQQYAPPPPPPPPPGGPGLPPGARPAPPGIIYQNGPGAPPPVVIYQPPPPVVVYQQGPRPVYPGYPPPMYYYHPRETWPRNNEWGLNLRLEGAAIPHGGGMGGAGFGLRYKPIPAFGIETNVDFLGGTDYNGFHRNETAFTVNGLVFLNPRSRAQVYLLAGFGWSNAAVDDGLGDHYNYSYFGGQAGIGLEFRLAKHFALNTDIRGFIRSRTDSGAASNPEFTDPQTGQTTNTSDGVLFTGGMTLYF